MKKIEEPIVKVVKLEAMDVIATSGDTNQNRSIGIQSYTDQGQSWYNN